MGEMVRESFTTEELAAAYKIGKRFLKKRGSQTDKKTVSFIQDPEAELAIGQEYNSLSFTECCFDPRTGILNVGVDLHLNRNAHICVGAKVVNLITGTVHAALNYEERYNSNQIKYRESAVLSGGSPAVKTDLVVIATANWQFEEGEIEYAGIFDDLQRYVEAYEHKFPKKEEQGYIEFTDNPINIALTEKTLLPANMDVEKRGDSDTINIALFRKPDDVRDLDYLCSFGKDSHGRPHFTVPAAGTITLNLGNRIIKSAVANCMIAEKDGTGGYYLAASSATLSQKIDITITKKNGKTLLKYEYTDPWDNAFMYGGSWQKYIFSYCLQIVLELELNEQSAPKGTVETVFLYVQTEKKSDTNLYNVPYIAIMWGCMAENTRITMADGSEKKIQDIAKGDEVAMSAGAATVKTKWKGPSDGYVIAEAAGRVLKMTKDHPVMTAQGWKRAGKLKITDELMDASQEFVKIDRIETRDEQIETFNLEYKDNENPLVNSEEYMIAEGFVVGNFKTQNSRNI